LYYCLKENNTNSNDGNDIKKNTNGSNSNNQINNGNNNNNNSYDNDNNISERVRQCFLNFFVATLSRYNFFVDQETQRIEEERFIKSMNLGHRQREYIRMIITSQMFEIFLSQQDLSSIRRRRLFDEYIIKHRGGVSDVGGGVFGGKVGGSTSTAKNKGKLSSSSETTTTTASKFDGFVNRKKNDHAAAGININNNNKKKKSSTPTPTPLLDSKQWKKPSVIVPQQPCVIGLKEGRVHCHDRRFPDHLNEDECITNSTVSSWKMFWDGTWLCSSILSCTY